MNTKIITCCVTLFLATLAGINAADPAAQNQAKPASADFERLKTLVGTWKGTADIGQGPVELSVQYRVLAAGSVIEERVFQNTPNEMVTMYYEKDGKVALTHYCMMGNRPAMSLKSSDTKTMTFDFDGACCTIDPKKEAHMHALTLRFDDADTITSSCVSMVGGEKTAPHGTTLKRVKSETTAAR